MQIFPAIDLFGGKAVRLFKGDYANMTVYDDIPTRTAEKFKSLGAKNIHIVDLEGAKDGSTPNLDVILSIHEKTGLFTEVGGGIRSMDTISKYLDSGIDRVILGTAAVNDEKLLKSALSKYGEKIAVGADIKDGVIAIRGWVDKSEYTADSFFAKMQSLGVRTIICTDISKDGAMRGTNLALYRELSEKYSVDIIASGGVSDISDIIELRKMNLYGAIIGKAYYVGAIELDKAIEVAK